MINSCFYVNIYIKVTLDRSLLQHAFLCDACACVYEFVWHRGRINVWCIIFTVHLTSQPKERYKTLNSFSFLSSSSFFEKSFYTFFCETMINSRYIDERRREICVFINYLDFASDTTKPL